MSSFGYGSPAAPQAYASPSPMYSPQAAPAPAPAQFNAMNYPGQGFAGAPNPNFTPDANNAWQTSPYGFQGPAANPALNQRVPYGQPLGGDLVRNPDPNSPFLNFNSWFKDIPRNKQNIFQPGPGQYQPMANPSVANPQGQFDSLYKNIMSMDQEALRRLDASREQYSTFQYAAQDFSNAFANKDYVNQVQGQQSGGFGPVDPSMKWTKENVGSWLDNSYQALMQRLNDSYLL